MKTLGGRRRRRNYQVGQQRELIKNRDENELKALKEREEDKKKAKQEEVKNNES